MSTNSSDKLFELPKLTYSERDLLVTTLNRRIAFLEMRIPEVTHETLLAHYHNELKEMMSLYNKFQSHF